MSSGYDPPYPPPYNPIVGTVESILLEPYQPPVLLPNLVFDSNLANAIAAVGPTWKANGTIGTANGDVNVLNPGTNNAEFVAYGTGAASGLYNIFDSQIIDVTPGATYTLSAFIDATASAEAIAIQVWNPSISTSYGAASQAAGTRGLVSAQVTIPAGATQVRVLPNVQNATIIAGATVSFSQIQLTETSVVQPYTSGPFWNANFPFNTPGIPANPPVSGNVYQNTGGNPIAITLPVTGGTSAGTVQWALGNSPTPGNWGAAETVSPAEVKNLTLVAPNYWYWSVTAGGTVAPTLGTASVLGY